MPRKIHIAVMAYAGELPVQQVTSIMATVQQITSQRQWNISLNFRVGDSILPRSRNAELANVRHDPDITDMIQIDADTFCSPEGIMKLLDADVDIVGAPYRTRNEPMAWPSVRWLHQDVELASNGLLEAEAIGTGMIRFSRKVIDALWDAEPRSYLDPTCKPGKAKPIFWFDIGGEVQDDPNCGHLWGEDITICKKARALGFKVWTDPTITTGHMGTHAFTANLGEYLAQQPEEILIDDVLGIKTMVRNGFMKPAGETPANDAPPHSAQIHTLPHPAPLPPPPGLHLPQVAKSEAA